jgi:hypothetical protein
MTMMVFFKEEVKLPVKIMLNKRILSFSCYNDPLTPYDETKGILRDLHR